jgi:hypothetical protein
VLHRGHKIKPNRNSSNNIVNVSEVEMHKKRELLMMELK